MIGCASDHGADNILDRLDVRVDAFAVCKIGDGQGLRVEPIHGVVVHYVLRGQGSIEWTGGSCALRPGLIAVIPTSFAKQINGYGPVLSVSDLPNPCRLTSGLVEYSIVGQAEPGLLIACATLHAEMATGHSLFQHLHVPLTIDASTEINRVLFEQVFLEVSNPRVGTQAIVNNLMKHILLTVARTGFLDDAESSPFRHCMLDAQLGKAVGTVVENPSQHHNTASLAKTAGMSATAFVSRFSEVYGVSPGEFVQMVRIRSAEQMLRDTKLPVKTIAASVGFASRSHFSRAFSKRKGLDPTAYRRGNVLTEAD